MIGIAELDTIIRLADDGAEPGSGELLYGVDRDTGQVYENKIPLLRKRKSRKYIVSSRYFSKPAEGETEVISVRDFAASRELGLSIRFQLVILSGGLEKLLNFVCAHETPELAILSAIEEAARSYIFSLAGKQADFLNAYAEHKTKLVDHIEHKLAELSGVQITAELKLKYQDQLESLPITKLTIPVRLKDNANEHSVTFSADLGVMHNAIVDAVCAYPQMHQLEHKLVKVIISYFSSEVSFHVFNNGFIDVDHQRGFEQRLNQLLRKEGRMLERWSLQTNIKGGKAKGFIPVEIEIPCTPHESEKPIIIKNKIHFILRDAGVFHKANVSNIQEWAKKVMSRIIQEETFKIKHLGFLLEFDAVEQSIKSRLEQASDGIGYGVKHLISKPDLPEYKLTEIAPYEFEYTDLSTRSASITTNLKVSVSFAIPKLRDVERWLNTNTNLEKAIKASIRTELQKVLQNEPPEQVYMQFSLPNENGISLEQTLSKAVRQHLEERYHATVDGSPNIIPANTDLGDFVQGLTNRILEFQFPIGMEHSDDHYSIMGNFSISQPDPNGWERIRYQNFTAEEVRDYFVKAAKAKFSIPSLESLLRYQTPQEREQLENAFEKNTLGEVSEKFGVMISITNVERTYSVGETKMDLVKQKNNERQRLYAQKDIEMEIAKLDHASEQLRDAQKLKSQANEIRFNELVALGKQIERHAEGDDEESEYIVKTKKAQLEAELAKSEFDLKPEAIEKRLKGLERSANQRQQFDESLWQQQDTTKGISKNED